MQATSTQDVARPEFDESDEAINGNGHKTARRNDLFEAGSAGEVADQLAELGLEAVAQSEGLPSDAEFGELDEVSSLAMADVDDEATDQESQLLDAYYGSYDVEPPTELDESDMAAEVVIDRDDRIRIQATHRYPWRVICSLRMRTRTGKTYIGTGWFINPRVVMTAGHCVYFHKEGGWAQSVTVMPGRNAANLPYGSVAATHLRSVTGWTQKRKRENDYGCIILPKSQRLGARTGWFGFAYMGDSSLSGKHLNLSGYPGDKPAGTQWYHHRKVKSVSSRTITYEIDTAGGQSGSPVYYIKDGKRYAVGIHTNGHSSGNSATRITKSVFNLMKQWKQIGS